MLEAHVNSMILLATPFRASTAQPFAFGQGSKWAEITKEIREQIPVMLKYRLTPPPRETYSLNRCVRCSWIGFRPTEPETPSRKLSGSFLLASRLGASVDTRGIWEKVVS